MAIRAGQILHVANQFVVDRIQTGGAGNLNIPQEKVFELGNYQSVGIIRDVPDLTFNLECLDVDTEVEALLTGSLNPFGDAANKKYELLLNKGIDIISPWKSPYGEFEAVKGVVVPGLALESASYRYGLRDNAGETFSLRGDSIFYVPGTPYQDVVTLATAGTAPTAETAFENGPALEYHESGQTLFALCVTVDGERYFHGTDYTDTEDGWTLSATRQDEIDAKIADLTGGETVMISVCYGSLTAAVYPQSGAKTTPPWGNAAPDARPVHEGVSVKPAAIRGKDIDVYFSTLIGATPVEVRWPDVQSATLEWRVTLEDDYEFGNPRAVSREPTDVPAVTGTVELKPRSVDAFFTRLTQITGVPADEIIGPQSSVVGALRIVLRNPESGGSTAVAAGVPLKTHYVPEARFTIPGYEGRVQQKYTGTVNFESDTGNLETFKGIQTGWTAP